MSPVATPGVAYWYDTGASAFVAPGRDPLYAGPSGWTAPPPVLAGSLPVGDAEYTLPATGGLYVSPSGSDSNLGTVGSPKRTLAAAITAAASGATIVLRAGTYHESVSTINGRVVTIQAYPGEEVWLDGSKVYSSWTSSSGTWTAPLGVEWSVIDSSRYSFQTSDQTGALPEQVWIDGVAQKQIADGATPTAGQFSVSDRSGARTLRIGTNPAGKEVRVSELRSAIVASGRINLYGIGIRRYSPTHVESGQNAMVYLGGTAQGSVFENVVFQDSGMTGFATARPVTLRNVTIQDCMNSGIQMTTADGSVIERFVVRRVNRGFWQMEPIISGIKVTYTDDLLIRHGIVKDAPQASGIWFDTHVRKYVVFNVDIDGTSAIGEDMRVAFEFEAAEGGLFNGLQHYGIVINCRARHARSAFKSLVGGWHKYVNCEAMDYNLVGFYLQQDARRNTENTSHGTIAESPWLTKDISLINNDVGAGSLPWISYHDPTAGWAQPILGWDTVQRVEGNWFRGTSSLAQLGRADGSRLSYTTLAALAASPSTVGVSAGKLGVNHQGASTPDDSMAVPLTAELAAITGAPEGLQRIGPFIPAPVATF